MDASVRTIVVVGAGQAGARGARALRDNGFAGRILLVGDEQELPYERPPLSKAFLKDPGTAVPYVLQPDAYDSLDIELLTGNRAEAIDRSARQVRLASGDRPGYDRLLLATGSRIRTLAIPGFPQSDLFSLRTLDDSRAIAARVAAAADRPPAVAIVGGGFIGLEVAATLSARGCAVTVVELAGRLLPRIGSSELSAYILDYHRSRGIDIRLGVSVAGGAPGHLVLGDGCRVDADFAVVGIGIVPNVELASEAGLAIGNGIIVDAEGRTSDATIFAAGDVTCQAHPLLGRSVRLESWHNANLQPEAAARAMLGLAPVPVEIPWVWSDQGDLNLQIAGMPVGVGHTVMRRDPADESASLFLFDGNRLAGGVTLNRGKDMIMIRRLLTAGVEIDDFDALSDPAVPLRQFMASARPADPGPQPISVPTGG